MSHRIATTDSTNTVRLLRNVAANRAVTNPKPDVYGLTDFSKSLSERPQISVLRYLYDINLPIFAALPQFLAEQGYKNPTDPSYAAFNLGKNISSNCFEYLSQNESQGEDFNYVMQGVGSNITRWVDMYPTEKLLEDDDGGVVVVDVGGSTGHDINAFQQKHRLADGRLVLQDLPDVIKRASVQQGITASGHNFFDPQPIQGIAIPSQ